MTSPIDPTRCPLCGAENECGAARGAGTCWCFAQRIPDDVLERIPPEFRDQVCICERCASGLGDRPKDRGTSAR
jgi:hypothetical protein